MDINRNIAVSSVKDRALVLLLVICSCKLSVAQNFTEAPISFPGRTLSKTQWVDINNDGRLDLFLSGISNNGTLESTIHVNNGDNSFGVIFLPAIKNVKYDFADFNLDGFIDLIIQGSTIEDSPRTILLRNLAGAGFEDVDTEFAQLSNGSVLFADFDTDGDSDVLIGGFDDSSIEQIFVYENDAGMFTEVETNLSPISNGDFTLFDLESDGIKELIVSGLSEDGNPLTTVYAITSPFHFDALDIAIPVTAFGRVLTYPVDDDFYEEIILAGRIGSELIPQFKNLKNTNGHSFSESEASFELLQQFSIDAGDLNHDGFTDLWMTGRNAEGEAQSIFYENNQTGHFLEQSNTVLPSYQGDASLADYDNDGDLDILQTGTSNQESGNARLWLSDQASFVVNSAPSTPVNLISEVQGRSVQLTWTRAFDDHTSDQGLSYNFYVSKESGGQELVVSPNSIVANGSLTIPQAGNNRWSNRAFVKDLEEGTYYWSVQSVDNSFASSHFASEQSFLICDSITLGHDKSLCYGDTLSLSMELDGGQVDWYSIKHGLIQSNSHTVNLSVTEIDSIIVVVSKPSGCVVKDTVVVTPISPMDFSLGADRYTCLGDTASFEPSPEVESINWVVNNVSIESEQEDLRLSVVTNDTIMAIIHDLNHCVNYDTIVSHVLDLPRIETGPQREVCLSDTAYVEILSDHEIYWSTDHNPTRVQAHTFQQVIIQDRVLYFEIVDANNCVNFDTLLITALPLPNIALGNDLSICENEFVELNAEANGQVSWYNPAGEILVSNSNAFSHRVVSNDTLVAQVTDNKNCVNRDTVVVNVLPLPIVDVGRDTSVCFGQSILIQAGLGFSTVEWFSEVSHAVVEENWFLDEVVQYSDSFRVKVTNEFGCVQFDSIKVHMNPLPEFSAGEDVSICEFDAVYFEINGVWTEVNWYFNDSEALVLNSQSVSFVPNESLTVFTEVIDSLGCVSYDTVNILVNALPSIELGEDLELCEDEQQLYQVDPLPDVHYMWVNQDDEVLSESPEVLVQPTIRKLILRIVDSNSCSTSDSINVAVHNLPVVDIQGDSLLCAGELSTWEIDNVQADTIVWWINDAPLVQAEPTVIFTTLFDPSDIRVLVTDVNGCSAMDSLDIIVYPIPIANAGEDLLLCYGDSGMIGSDQPNDLVFSWSPSTFLNDPSISNPTTNPEISIDYVLTVSNILGCYSTDTIKVEVNPQIFIDAGVDSALCLNQSIELGGSPTASGSRFPFLYEWSDDQGILISDQANPIVSPLQSAKYYLLVSTGKCEVFLDSISVEVFNPPSVSVSAPEFTGVNQPIQLVASGAEQYAWSPPEGLSSITVHNPIANPLQSTMYSVVGMDRQGCIDSASIQVNVLNSVFLPSVFTPNGDGRNDHFKVYGAGIETLALTIYDQEGNVVFHSDDWRMIQTSGWDGSNGGNMLETDVYLWIIKGKYYNGDEVTYHGKTKGFLKLLR